ASTMRLQDKRLFLLDMDGTLYLGDRLFPDTAAFLRHIHESGGRALFLTNNSSKSADAYVEKLARLGIAARREDFLTSVDATIPYLQERGFAALYVCGTASCKAQLRGAGLSVTERWQDGDCLLCGFDTELTFEKLEDACRLLTAGVPFVATNPDWVCPTEFGFVPDCGSVCEMLFRATGRRPVVIGKPEPAMALLAMERTGFLPEETLLVGDRLYTDIACGLAAGIDTALVLSGETTAEMAADSPTKPTAIFRDVGALLAALCRE
ncbi:MAG: HAD-IIA family hydrolase, partial [Oscillospiraceae bacterium]